MNTLNYRSYSLGCNTILIVSLSPILFDLFYDLFNPTNNSFDNILLLKHNLKIVLPVVASIITASIPLYFLSKKWSKVYFGLLILIIGLPALIDFGHCLIYHNRLMPSSIYSILESNSTETKEFVTNYSTWRFLLQIVSLFGCTYLLRLTTKFIGYKTSSFVLIIIGLTCFILPKIKPSLSWENELSSIKLINTYQEYKNELELLKEKKEISLPLNKVNDKEETIVIVIGESTSAKHMQLYGYNEPTTPELSKIKDELYIFKNVHTEYVHTIESLKKVLLFENENDKTNIINHLNNAGYETFWISNQAYFGKHETLISTIANRADHKIFTNKKKYDGWMLNPLVKTLKNPAQKKVIFVHLIGAHLPYQNRYPLEFKKIKNTNTNIPLTDEQLNTLNHYDNAILYNDYVIKSVIDSVKKNSKNSALIYFSDHGDEVYDFRDFHGHQQSLKSEYMTHVPLIMWFSEKYKANNPLLNTTIFNSLRKPLKLSDLKFKIFELLQMPIIKSPDYNVYINRKNTNTNSIICEGWNYFPDFKSKIGCHRVNSIERLKDVINAFDAIEIDVVFSNGKFDVRHPPETSISLTLEQIISSTSFKQMNYFWLDIKNLNNSNKEDIGLRLDQICGKKKIKDKLIIESQNCISLAHLGQNGYYTSYYLPDFSKLNSDSVNSIANKVVDNIITFKPNAISQSVDNYVFLKKNFPKYPKLIWSLKQDYRNSIEKQKLIHFANKDSSLKCLLVRYDSKNWR